MWGTAYYFLQVMACSAMLLGYYWIVLRNKQFHQYNRFYLLGTSLLAWVVPLIKISWFKPVTTSTSVQQLLTVIADTNTTWETETFQQTTWQQTNVWLGIYLTGIIVLLVLFVYQLIRIYRLLQLHSCKQLEDYYLILTQTPGTPFSFFKYIFWNEAIDLKTTTGKQILTHELVHVKQKHSLDKLLIQLVVIFGWFNPFFWLIRKEIGMVHEFIADRQAVKDGDAARLAEMLLLSTFPQHQLILSQSFFFSPIKRRLSMLSKNKKQQLHYARKLIVLPLFATMIILFAFRSTKNTVQSMNDDRLIHLALEKKYKVVVNAGHGGTDRGALAADGTTEAELTLQLAKKIASLNANGNIEIVLTRNDDRFQSVADVSTFANYQQPALFLSLHVNTDEQPSKTGIEMMIADKEKAINYQANYLFANSVANQLQQLELPFLGIHSRKSGIWVLQAIKCPSLLIETGFLSNANDLKKLKSEQYQEAMATRILNGIQQYLSSQESK